MYCLSQLKQIVLSSFLIFLVEEILSFYITGGFIISVERRVLLLIPIILSITAHIIATPQKNIRHTYNSFNMFNISSIYKSLEFRNNFPI